ncbi:MAG: DUF922 domain-containing protein [Desulfuromonadaceae bacterium]|nr:DUF922 domain-containing protein [Desulfuromonadaceae bacterium]
MMSEISFRIIRSWKPLLLVLAVFLGTDACADMYSYVDKGGTMVFTDNPANIPLKLGKVRRIPDGAKSIRPVARTVSSPEPATNPLPVRKDAPEVYRQNLVYDIGGYTFLDIRREINRRSPKRINNKLAIGWCSWQVEWNIHTRQRENRCEVAFVDTSVAISITLPRWRNYASAGVGMKEAWDLYYGSVQSHEELHASHGVAAARDIQRRLSELEGRSSCNSIQEEGRYLASRIIKENREKDVELDRVSGDDFDTITDVEMAGDKRDGVLGRQYPAHRNAQPR